jgi:hypothetical protein
MTDYTCKIPRSNNVFIGSESAGASSDTLINVISPLAVGYPSRSGMGSDYRYSILSAGVATLNAPTAHTGYEENSSAAIPLSEPRKDCWASQPFPWCREPQYPTRDKVRDIRQTAYRK